MSVNIPAGQTRPVPTHGGKRTVQITPINNGVGFFKFYIPSGSEQGDHKIPYPQVPPLPSFDFDINDPICGYNDEQPLVNQSIDVVIF